MKQVHPASTLPMALHLFGFTGCAKFMYHLGWHAGADLLSQHGVAGACDILPGT